MAEPAARKRGQENKREGESESKREGRVVGHSTTKA